MDNINVNYPSIDNIGSGKIAEEFDKRIKFFYNPKKKRN